MEVYNAAAATVPFACTMCAVCIGFNGFKGEISQPPKLGTRMHALRTTCSGGDGSFGDRSQSGGGGGDGSSTTRLKVQL